MLSNDIFLLFHEGQTSTMTAQNIFFHKNDPLSLSQEGLWTLPTICILIPIVYNIVVIFNPFVTFRTQV